MYSDFLKICQIVHVASSPDFVFLFWGSDNPSKTLEYVERRKAGEGYMESLSLQTLIDPVLWV